MTPAQKRYLLPFLLFRLGMVVTIALINLYLWELTKTLSVILQFNIAVFAGIILGSLLAGVIATHLSSALGLFLAALLFCLQIAGLHVTEAQVIFYLYEIGIISGIAIGLYKVSATSTEQAIITPETLPAWSKVSNILTTLLLIVAIPLFTYVIQISHSYSTVFLPSIGLFLAAAISTALIKLPDEEKLSFHHQEGILLLFNTPKLRKVMRALFLEGVQEGLYWAVLGIFTLELFGNLVDWGLFSAGLNIIAIITVFFVTKATLSQKKAIDITSAFLFAGATLMLVQHWNLLSFVVYQIAVLLLNSTMATNLGTHIDDLILSDRQLRLYRHEHNAYREVIQSLGRLLPLYILLLAHVTVIDTVWLKALFLLVAPIPFLVMTIIGNKNTSSYV